jgi:ABC-2 type transport system permease protein
VIGWIALKIKLWFIFRKAAPQEIAVGNTSQEDVE